MNIKLDLTVQETNIILKYLGKGSYDEVAGLIAKIKSEGDKQIAEKEEVLTQAGLFDNQ
jgi:hypothetical protein